VIISWFVPDLSAAPDEPAVLRAANARLRQVIEAKDTEIAALRVAQQALGTQVAELRAANERLAAAVAELTARLRANSQNSSRPPSSERLAKPAPRSLRKKTGRRPGRPKGQPGATLEMTTAPDEVIAHEPGRAPAAGATWPGRSRRGRSAVRSSIFPRSGRMSPSTG
jgi:hypothetical protein